MQIAPLCTPAFLTTVVMNTRSLRVRVMEVQIKGGLAQAILARFLVRIASSYCYGARSHSAELMYILYFRCQASGSPISPHMHACTHARMHFLPVPAGGPVEAESVCLSVRARGMNAYGRGLCPALLPCAPI